MISSRPSVPSLVVCGDVHRLADRLSPPPSLKHEWSDLEKETCMAMVLAALRQKDLSKLKTAIDTFGGLPQHGTKNHALELLSHSAKDPSAFGFEQILMTKFQQRSPSNPAEWLRKGLRQGWWEERRFISESLQNSATDEMPIAACFAADNPRALACILAHSDFFSALCDAEPLPMSPFVYTQNAGLDRRAAYVKHVRTSQSDLDTSLMSQAVEVGAFRCAALLAALPPFGHHPMNPGALGEAVERSHRQSQQVFEEKIEHTERCIFEDALLKWKAAQERGQDHKTSAWDLLLESMITHAPERALSWRQDGTGMGWPEMYMAHLCPFRYANQRSTYSDQIIQKTIDTLSQMQKRGFKIQWKPLIELCAPPPQKSNLLHDWMTLQSVARPPKNGPKKSGASLSKTL